MRSEEREHLKKRVLGSFSFDLKKGHKEAMFSLLSCGYDT